MKTTTTEKDYLMDKIAEKKLLISQANEDGDFQAFRYHFHQLVKLQGRFNKLNNNVYLGR